MDGRIGPGWQSNVAVDEYYVMDNEPRLSDDVDAILQDNPKEPTSLYFKYGRRLNDATWLDTILILREQQEELRDNQQSQGTILRSVFTELHRCNAAVSRLEESADGSTLSLHISTLEASIGTIIEQFTLNNAAAGLDQEWQLQIQSQLAQVKGMLEMHSINDTTTLQDLDRSMVSELRALLDEVMKRISPISGEGRGGAQVSADTGGYAGRGAIPGDMI